MFGRSHGRTTPKSSGSSTPDYGDTELCAREIAVERFYALDLAYVVEKRKVGA